MKKFLTLFLLAAGLTGLGQDSTNYCSVHHMANCKSLHFKVGDTVSINSGYAVVEDPNHLMWHKRDTTRVTLMITTGKGKPRCIPFTIPGYVVNVGLFEKLYLDDRKRVIKAPVEVWGYKLK